MVGPPLARRHGPGAVRGTESPKSALAPADRLDGLGFGADVLCVSSPDLLFRAVKARRGLGEAGSWILETLRGPWSPCWTGTRTRWRSWPGSAACPPRISASPAFGQSGDLADVYRYHGLDADAIIAAALDLVD